MNQMNTEMLNYVGSLHNHIRLMEGIMVSGGLPIPPLPLTPSFPLPCAVFINDKDNKAPTASRKDDHDDKRDDDRRDRRDDEKHNDWRDGRHGREVNREPWMN